MPSPSPSVIPSEPDLAVRDQSRKRGLLIVDDEEGPRQSLRILFKDEFDLVIASSGAEALELVRQRPVDAAILDIKMPGMSGIDLLGQLKQMDAAVEVIMLTAYETVETARQALRLGACDYLTKPFDLPTVRNAVARAMQRRAFTEQVRATDERLKALQDAVEDHRLREEIIRNRGEIYSSILHDINGPLTIISSFVSMINSQLSSLKSLDPSSTQEFKERLEAVDRYATNCVNLTHRYLSFLRQGGSEPQGVSVNQTLRDTFELLRVHPLARANRIEIVPLPNDAPAKINGTDLIQILLNLSVNALQATSAPHLVEISAWLCSVPLEETLFQDGPTDRFIRHPEFKLQQATIAVQVRDTGPGMAPEVVQQLFHSYFTSKPPPEGTGLGLSIVKRLVMSAQSALTMHTEPSVGTAFVLYLPLKINGGLARGLTA